jgi:hypothetical protein
MKYIKLFEQHSSTLEDNINAALVELEDLGFKVMKTFYLNDDKNPFVGYENQKVDIRILKPDDSNRMTLFEYDKIDDIIMTLIDYLKEVWGFVSSEFSYSFRNPSKRSYGGLTTTKGVPRGKSILDLTLSIKEVIFPIKTSDVRAYEGMYYSDEMKRTINDILVELRDEGFKYFFNDIREGLTITLEKDTTFSKSDIVETFLMLEDYMREEWVDIKISYQYYIVRPGNGNVYHFGISPDTKVNTVADIKMESLVKVKFMCSRI